MAGPSANGKYAPDGSVRVCIVGGSVGGTGTGGGSTGGGITQAQVQSAMEAALTSSDVELTQTEIQAAFEAALASSTSNGLTQAEVQAAVEAAITNADIELSAADFQSAMEAALTNVGNGSGGLTQSETQAAFEAALANAGNGPNLTQPEVQAAFEAALTNAGGVGGGSSLTQAEVQSAVEAAITNADIELTAADFQAAFEAALANAGGGSNLTQAETQAAFEAALANAGGGTNLTQLETQAAFEAALVSSAPTGLTSTDVQTAIESANNLDGLEQSLIDILAQLTSDASSASTSANQAAQITLLNDVVTELQNNAPGTPVTAAEIQTAIENSANIDGLETALADILAELQSSSSSGTAITEAEVLNAIQTASNIDGLEGLLSIIGTSLTADLEPAVSNIDSNLSLVLTQLSGILSAILNQKDFSEFIVLDISDDTQYIRQREVNEDGTLGVVRFFNFDGTLASPQPSAANMTAAGGGGGAPAGGGGGTSLTQGQTANAVTTGLTNYDAATAANQTALATLISTLITETQSAGANLTEAELLNALQTATTLDGVETALADILAELQANGSATSITQAEVQAAIEAASNLDGLEQSLLDLIAAQSTSTSDTTAANQTTQIARLDDIILELQNNGSSAGITQAQVQLAIESAANIDGLEQLLTDLIAAQSTADSTAANQVAGNLTLTDILVTLQNSAFTATTAANQTTQIDRLDDIIVELQNNAPSAGITGADVQAALEAATNLDTLDLQLADILSELVDFNVNYSSPPTAGDIQTSVENANGARLDNILAELTSILNAVVDQEDYSEIVVVDTADGTQYLRRRTVNEDGTTGDNISYYTLEGLLATPQPNPANLEAFGGGGSSSGGTSLTEAQTANAVDTGLTSYSAATSANQANIETVLNDILVEVAQTNLTGANTANQASQTTLLATIDQVLDNIYARQLVAANSNQVLVTESIDRKILLTDILAELQTANGQASITQAEVQTAIENAANLDGLESSLADIATALDANEVISETLVRNTLTNEEYVRVFTQSLDGTATSVSFYDFGGALISPQPAAADVQALLPPEPFDPLDQGNIVTSTAFTEDATGETIFRNELFDADGVPVSVFWTNYSGVVFSAPLPADVTPVGINSGGGGGSSITEAQTASAVATGLGTHDAATNASLTLIEAAITDQGLNLDESEIESGVTNALASYGAASDITLSNLETAINNQGPSITQFEVESAVTSAHANYGVANAVTQFDIATAIGNSDSGITAEANTGGGLNLLSLEKRDLAIKYAVKTDVSTSISTLGTNNIIASPPAGQQIVITYFSLQNETGNETLALIQGGASTEVKRVRTLEITSGLAEEYSLGNELVLAAGASLDIDLSQAEAHDVVVRYYLRNATTLLPV